MTQAAIATIVGIIISFLVELVPGLKDWWAKFQWRRLALFGFFLVVAAAWWALDCFTPIDIGATGLGCDINGAIKALAIGFIGFMSSQGAFTVVTRELANARARNGT